MEKEFNVLGTCFPKRHYMVDLTERVAAIRKMIDRGDYFSINRGRQYGKTTTLYALRQELRKDYVVVSLDFQEMDTAMFADADVFARVLCDAILNTGDTRINAELLKLFSDLKESNEKKSIYEFGNLISSLCLETSVPIVIIMDGVDSVASYNVFADFLSLLKSLFLNREDSPAFQSVILVGNQDIKDLRPDGVQRCNSPWNITAPFDVRMSFNVDEIAGMLRQYEDDHHSGMDIELMAKNLFDYTHGYPVMVSWLCKTIAEKLGGIFTTEKLKEAVDMMLNSQDVAVLGSLLHHIELYPEFKKLLKNFIYTGWNIPYEPFYKPINIGLAFSYLRQVGTKCVIANWIFEQCLVKYFLAEDSQDNKSYREGLALRNQFVTNDEKLDI